jgi:hypothetical protein
MRVRLGAYLCVAFCCFAVLASPCLAAGSGRAVTTPLTSGAVGADCSKAAALAVVTRLHLNDPEVTNPVSTVLCGSFTGPGSQTMVVSLFGPGNTGMIDWVVFRWDGNAWQFVMKQHQAAMLSAAGSDIRETVSIFRASDPRCCPSGGKKTRIWHWNGSAFVAGPWKQVQAGAGFQRAKVYFYSPSRNIACTIWGGRRPDVYCQINEPPGHAALDAKGRVQTCRGRGCLGNYGEGDVPPATMLGYGRQVTSGQFRCLSQRSGVTCVVVRSGKGFMISRAGVRRVGP